MSGKVLVLNASYEPISLTRFGRAMAMIVNGTAVVEEAIPDKFVRHASGMIPWPRVLRLIRYVKVPFRAGPTPWSRRGVLERDGHTCVFCSKHANTIEHILPKSRGGEARCWLNTVAACSPCNNKKGNRTLEESGMVLLFEPFIPSNMVLRTAR